VELKGFVCKTLFYVQKLADLLHIIAELMMQSQDAGSDILGDLRLNRHECVLSASNNKTLNAAM
jgi:hypothetical protein